MSLDYLGSLTLATAVVGAEVGATAGAAGINGALPDIAARLAALSSFAPVAGDFAADLALANSIVASLTAAISGGMTPPSIAAQIAIIEALIASLTATVAAVNANLTIVTDLLALLSTGGVFAYAYAGPANGLGAALTSELAGGFPGGAPTDATNALILATTAPATWTAMQALFKTTP